MPNLGPVIYMPRDPREAAIKEMAENFAQGYREKEEKQDLERAMKEIGEATSIDEAFKVAPPAGIQSAQDLAAWNAIIRTRHPTNSVQPKLVTVYDQNGNETKEWLSPGQNPSSGLTLTKPGEKQEWYSADFKPLGQSETRPQGGMTLDEMKESRARRTEGDGGKPTDKDKAIRDFIADTPGLENNARGRKIARNILFKAGDAEGVLKRSYFDKLPGGEWSLSGDADKRKRYYHAQRRARELMLQGKGPREAAMDARKEADSMTFDEEQPAQQDTTLQPQPEETGIGDKILSMLGGGEEFDPEGDEYDYKTAKNFGIRPDATGHWPSRAPNGQILKGKKHKTFHKTVEGEKNAGFNIQKGGDGRYYSIKSGEDTIPALPRDPASRKVGAKYKHPNGQTVEWDGKQLLAVEK